jgi:hypothetical protein
MTHRLFLHEDRAIFLMNEMSADKAKVIETDNDGISTIDVIIDDSLDLLKVFHTGIELGSTRITTKSVLGKTKS